MHNFIIIVTTIFFLCMPAFSGDDNTAKQLAEVNNSAIPYTLLSALIGGVIGALGGVLATIINNKYISKREDKKHKRDKLEMLNLTFNLFNNHTIDVCLALKKTCETMHKQRLKDNAYHNALLSEIDNKISLCTDNSTVDSNILEDRKKIEDLINEADIQFQNRFNSMLNDLRQFLREKDGDKDGESLFSLLEIYGDPNEVKNLSKKYRKLSSALFKHSFDKENISIDEFVKIVTEYQSAVEIMKKHIMSVLKEFK